MSVCMTTVWSEGGWRSHPCGRPTKGLLDDGTEVCGIHLRAEKTSKDRAARNQQGRERLARLSSRLGVVVLRDTAGFVSCSLLELEALADRLAALTDEGGTA